jgi:S1-C subfamily serine protease
MAPKMPFKRMGHDQQKSRGSDGSAGRYPTLNDPQTGRLGAVPYPWGRMGRRRDPALLWLLACLVVLGVFVAAAVLVGVGNNGDSDATDEDQSELAGDCHSEETPRARALLECLSPALAFVETPLGTGSAILLTDGMAVTNEHVVHPFAEVDVVLQGGERHEGVAVAGVDPLSDVALLGPIDTALPGTKLSAADDFEQGVDVFLVGFPGEAGVNPKPAISRGILSRMRQVREFGQTHLQTDAAIGGGQSGGALVDGRGRVIGLSGLSFAEKFALALSADDVEAALERIRSDESRPYRPFPTGGGVTKGSFRLADRDTFQVLAIPAAPNGRTIRLTLPPDVQPAIEVVSLYGDMLFINQAMLDFIAEFEDLDESRLSIYAHEPVAPGVFEFDIPADAPAIAFVGARLANGADVAFSATTPVVVIRDDDQEQHIVAGDRIEDEIDVLDRSDDYVIYLDAGEAVEIFVGSPSVDMSFTVRARGERLADAFFSDDAGGGLYGSDARDVFVADEAGEYTIQVAAVDFDVAGYVLRVEPTS